MNQQQRPAQQPNRRPTPKKKKKKFSLKRGIRNYKRLRQEERDSRRVTKRGSIPRSSFSQYDMVDSNNGRYATATTHDAVLRAHEEKQKKKRRYNPWRLIPFILVCLLVLAGLVFGIIAIVHKMNSKNSNQTEEAASPAKGQSVSFTFTASGDNLIHQRLYEQAKARSTDGTYDFSYCYSKVADFYKEHDVNWFNQESLANNKLQASSYPTFSTPGQAVEALYDMNVRVFSIANNHTYDKGATGLDATVDFYENDMPDDICYSGLWNKDDLTYIPTYEYEGKTIAFLSYTYGTNGISTPSDSTRRVIYTEETDVIKAQVEKANQIADVVIVGCHWGTEDSHTIISDQTTLAQNLADWGADLIIGTHPHVVQDAAWITAADGRKVFCAYSLGNFISTQSKPDQVVGVVLDCTINIDADGTVTIQDPKLVPTVTVYGSNASNCHTVFLKDYTATEALKHGVRNKYSYFNYQWIVDMLSKYIDKEFLELPEGASSTSDSSSTNSATVSVASSSESETKKSSSSSSGTSSGSSKSKSKSVNVASVEEDDNSSTGFATLPDAAA